MAAVLEPAGDINDVYVWMSPDATKVNLAMTVFPGATDASKFSDAVKYVFHARSQAAYGATAGIDRDIVCTFTSATPQITSCWLINNVASRAVMSYVSGNASGATGITAAGLQVFAGLRADPFFFNLAGFRNATAVVAAAIKDSTTATPTFIKGANAAGCPTLTSAARAAVTNFLGKDCIGRDTPVDFFKKPVAADNMGCEPGNNPSTTLLQRVSVNAGTTGNVLTIVVQADKALLTLGGPVLSVWGATTK
jgi:hypothetical protein